jgi:hypothetical protein
MAQEGPNRWAEWLAAVRQGAPRVREAFDAWLGQVREEPSLIWQTPVVRYVTYCTLGLLGVWMVTAGVELITPPPPASAKPEATSADFHVVCSDSSCGQHFVIHREFGFRKFPVECARCKKPKGSAARRCSSPDCQGRWVAPLKDDQGRASCPNCGNNFE